MNIIISLNSLLYIVQSFQPRTVDIKAASLIELMFLTCPEYAIKKESVHSEIEAIFFLPDDLFYLNITILKHKY